MWTRKELKEKGKAGMHRNYWKTVLVSLILMIAVGGMSFSAGAGSAFDDRIDEAETQVVTEMPEGMAISAEVEGLPDDLADELNDFREEAGGIGLAALGIGAFLLFIVLFAVISALHAFLLNPLEAGISRFFLRNLNSPAEVKELAYCYDHSYLNTVKTIFLKDLYIFLWCFVLFIPGIIKTYQYRLVEYILAEHPEMSTKEVLAESREMMKGNKWRAFVLDLSFIGWHLLSLITLGLVGVFYVMPYQNMTNAALYEYLAYGRNEGEVVVWTES